MKGIVTAGFLAGLAISSYSSAYSSYTGVTSPVENAYALKQKQTTVYYTKEPQRAIMWEKDSAAGDLVGKRNAKTSVGDYAYRDEPNSPSYINGADTSDTPVNVSSNLTIPVGTTGKVHRVKITKTLTGTHNHAGWYCFPYWTTASGSTQLYLTAGKQYVLTCYAKGKGKWIIGDEQDAANWARDSERLYTLSENSWTKVEQVFTANTESAYHAFIQYAHNPTAGDYCDVTDVFISEVKSSQTKTVLNPIGTMDNGSGIAGFKGWASTPDKCGVGYDSSDADGKTSDIVPVEGKVYYPAVKRYAIDVNCERDGGFNPTDIPANLTLRINGVAVANNRHGDIFTSAPEGASYSLSIDSTDAGYRYKGLGTTGASFNVPDEYIKNYGVSIKGTGSTPATTALSGTVSGNMSFDLLFARVYKITWNLDGGSGSYETSYESSDNDYVVTPPSRSGYGFAGWTGTGLSASTVNLVIPKGSTGDRVYTAHWGSTPVEVTCEEWTIDYNGNPYRYLKTEEQKYYFAPGVRVSAEMWSPQTIENNMYSVYKYTSITVSSSTHTVQKLLNRYNYANIFSKGYSGGSVRFTADLQLRFRDKDNNIIHTESASIDTDGWDWVDYGTIKCEGIDVLLTNVKSPEGYSLQNSIPSGWFNFDTDGDIKLIWNRDSGNYWVATGESGYIWDDSLHAFRHLNYSFPYGGKIKYCYLTIQEPGEEAKKVNYTDASGRYPKGTTFRFDNIPSSYDTYSGWKLYPKMYAWYYGGGIGANNWATIVDNTFTLDAPIHIDGFELRQDAYGIVFNANGGSGTMYNQCIKNTDSDDNRRLSANTYSPPGDLSFKGWATTKERAQNGTVDYSDRAVMPKETTIWKLSEMKTLYAVWG